MGVFISLEGIDGSGKTSVKEKLLYHLQEYDPVSVREPGGTHISEKIRELLLDVRNEGMVARTEAMLYAAARSQLVEEVIKPALEQGKIVIADRYMDSTIAYQGYARGIDISFLNDLNQLCTGGLKPQLTLLLDVEPEEGFKRRKDTIPDRLEKEGIIFQGKVRQGYLQIAAKEPERVKVINANQSLDSVIAEVFQLVDDLMKKV